MIVIEGRAMKSLEIMSMMKRWKQEETLFIDTKGGLDILTEGMILKTPNDLDNIINTIKKESDQEGFQWKRVVFYGNEPKGSIFKVWKLEQDLMSRLPFRECVMTIQTEDENISVYEI